MKKNKLLTLVLVIVMIAAAVTGAVMVFAVSPPAPVEDIEHTQAEEQAYDDYDAEERAAYYLSVAGTVVSVEEDADQEGSYTIEVEIDEETAHIIVTDRTVFPFSAIEDIEEGDIVTAFFPANAPMMMIYPPRYVAAVLIAGMPDDVNFQVDRFEISDNENFPFLAHGGNFAFAIGEDTEVILADGSEFLGEFEDDGIEWENTVEDMDGRRLVVIYGVSTRSIPEYATAIKVIVLYEDAVTLPIDIDVEIEIDFGDIFDVENMAIVVDGEEIEAPQAFLAEDGFTIMVPLRAIAEALDFEVTWVAEDRAVELAGMQGVAEISARIEIGNTEATQTFARRAPITVELPVAPVIVGGYTYVPLTVFFQEVLEMPNAWAFEGRIEVLSEGERMV